jgi:hypothetical protein
MLRVRLILSAFLLAGLGAAVSSTPASAAGQWWVNRSAFTEEASTSGEQYALAVLEANIGKIKTAVQCGKTITKGTIQLDNKDSTSLMAFSGCTVTQPKGCTVLEPVPSIEQFNSELEVEGTKVFDRSTGTKSSKLLLVTISGGTCSVEGKYEVTGDMRCEVVQPEKESVIVPCTFSSTSGSELRIGANALLFTDLVLTELTGGNVGLIWSGKTK